MSRIGVFVCWCGSSIAEQVDIREVSRYGAMLPGVVKVIDHQYLCSESGQKLIVKTIREQRLDGVVVAACSPGMHQVTFRRAVTGGGLNPYLLEIANVQEHCSRVYKDRSEATARAKNLVRMMVERVKWNRPLDQVKLPVTRRALVIGAGIAGIQASLDIAACGYEVVLVEKKPSIGGHVAQLAEIFPPLGSSPCIMTPYAAEVVQNPNITLYPYAELESLEGYAGNFTARIRKKARFVDASKCTGCGICQQKCPVSVKSEFNEGLSFRPAVYLPFPYAVPNTAIIDRENCLRFQEGTCSLCQEVCPTGAIDYRQKDEIISEEAGAIVVATGYDLMAREVYAEYGGGQYPDVITSLQFERLMSASGPTRGLLRRPSDGRIPGSVVFIQCVGSMDASHGIPYCSRICCTYTAKQAMLFRHQCPDGRAYVFHVDIRAAGNNYHEYVRKAIEEYKTVYIRGRVSRVFLRDGCLVVSGVDAMIGEQVEIEADLVVLAAAVTASSGVENLARKLGIAYDLHHFLSEAHPGLRPIETNSMGIYLAGACQAPKDIPETVAQAGAAAAKVLGLFGSKDLFQDPSVARVNENTCTGCLLCQKVCTYNAIEIKGLKNRRGDVVKIVSSVNTNKCRGCGTCAAECRSHSIEFEGFNDQQIYAQINALGLR
ncbi:MAG: CoB--CoM heterodisulfide reductase iron-sulfur subunit A family protein [bacterium]